MSFAAIRWALSQDSLEDPREFLLLVVLANYHDDRTGQCNPSRDSLMKKSRIGNSNTLTTKLMSLQKKGLIQIFSKVGKSNQYGLNITTFSTEAPSEVKHLQNLSTFNAEVPPPSELKQVPPSELKHEPINNINNNINNVVNTTSPSFELTADEQEPKKTSAQKTRPITHSFDLKEIPEEWITLCEKLRPDLEPYKAFVEFQFYWQDGAGASTKRSDNGWRTTWLNYLKSPRTRPTPRPTPRPQTFNSAHCLAEPAGGYTTEFYESQMSWEEMNEKRRNGEL